MSATFTEALRASIRRRCSQLNVRGEFQTMVEEMARIVADDMVELYGGTSIAVTVPAAGKPSVVAAAIAASVSHANPPDYLALADLHNTSLFNVKRILAATHGVGFANFGPMVEGYSWEL